MGPSGGSDGGYIISESAGTSVFSYSINFKMPKPAAEFISIYDMNFHNLKNINVSIPCGRITCISGVSGSGKSSLVSVLADCCEKQRTVNCSRIENISQFKKVLYVNQQPIGKTPRSTVISYLGIYEAIRKAFAETAQAKNKGLAAANFSMNIESGRCELCQGTGKKKIELTYMPDTYMECPECHGRRFCDTVLSVKYRGNTINDILNKSINEIKDLFSDIPNINTVLQCMVDIGMGYISLGQMSMNLSGGEAQRIKLAKCLGIKPDGRNLYILDEPTSGLNTRDMELLKNILFRLSNENETIVIIEHNIEFIAQVADYMVDLGSITGDKGGHFLLQGLPADVINDKNSSWSKLLYTIAE